MKSRRRKAIQGSFVYNGVWKDVKRSSFVGCCDCGLVHRIDFRSKNGKLQQRFFRRPRLTAQARRQFKHQFPIIEGSYELR